MWVDFMKDEFDALTKFKEFKKNSKNEEGKKIQCL